MAVSDGMPLLINKDALHKYSQDLLLQILKTDELVVVPLKAKDKVNGIIVADNIFTHKPISKDDLRMLIMLANQAGLAIENSQLYEQTVTRAHTDSLTKLWNHGYFQYLLQQEFEKTKALNLPLSLLMIDIDNFKNYNDTLGHQMGDQILEEVSLILKDHSRKMDYVCRYGGEEFTIIMPQTEKKEAFNLAERLRQTIENHHFPHEEIQPHQQLTVSLGVATFPYDCQTKQELIAYSDKALYKAKNLGKNRTCN
jgi:diguanylate cyclase (GGDEF)-like protein